MTARVAGDRTSLLSASACSVEIFVHQFLLLALWAPLFVLVVPFLINHFGISLIGIVASASRSQPPGQDFSLFGGEAEVVLAAALTLLTAGNAARAFRRSRRDFDSQAAVARRYLAPTGASGEALKARVAALWARVAPLALAPPDVVWFPNVSLLACALLCARRPTLGVSVGLWTTLEGEGSPLAEIILCHELAHLRYRDPARFRMLQAIEAGTSRGLQLLLWAIAIVASFVMASAILTQRQAGSGALLRQELMVAAIALLAATLCPLAAALVRRYVGLITSLVELRADVQSAAWTGGLGHFTQVLANHPLVHRSTWIDRSRSWFSLRLTHLSESERIEILGNSERLLTPKVQYLLFSLLLVLLLPLNGLTPLLFGGLLDMASALVIALALMSAVTTMIVLAGGAGVRLSAARLLALSCCVVLFTATCHLNFYTLTYSTSALVVEFGLRTGSDTVLGAFGSAFHDLGEQVLHLWTGGWLLCSLLVDAAAVAALAATAGRLQAIRPAGSLSLAAVALAAGAGTLIDGYDPWRGFLLDPTALGRVAKAWAGLTARLPGLRFTLGPCLAVTAALVLLLLALAAPAAARLLHYRSPPSDRR